MHTLIRLNQLLIWRQTFIQFLNGVRNGLCLLMHLKLSAYLLIDLKDPFLPPLVTNGVQLPENSSFCLLGLAFSDDFTWNTYIETIAKATAMNVGSLFRSCNFISSESILYLYKATIRPCMEYCCHIWAGTSTTCLRLLDQSQRWIIISLDLICRLNCILYLIVEMQHPFLCSINTFMVSVLMN